MLTFDDEGIYFGINIVDPAKFETTIVFLTAIVEGQLGAQRELSKKLRVERQSLHTNQREYFPQCWPIDIALPVVVENRWINRRDRFRRPIADSPWETLGAGDYELDEKSIRFTGRDIDLTQDFRRGRPCGGQRQIRLTYTGGFDFTINTSKVAALKAAMGQLLEYHAYNMSASDMRIQTEDVSEESRTTYFGTASKGSQPGTVAMGGFPEHLLLPFQTYRPYVYRF